MVKVANGEPKPQPSHNRKAKAKATEILVPDGNDTTSYLTNGTNVKISVSPKEISIRHLEDTSIVENFITNTTRVEETAVSLDMEKYLERSNFAGIFEAHLATVSRNSHGSEGTLSSPDNSHRLKSSCKRDHLSDSKNREPTNSESGVNIEVPLKGKKKLTHCIKPHVYDDALDITEHHTHSKNERDLSNSTESSYTSIIKQKALEPKLKRKIISVKKQDLFDVLHQTKHLVKDTTRKSGSLNTDSDINNCYDQPKKFESRSSTDSILNMKPKFLLRKKASRVREKNGFGSLMMDTCNNIEPIAVIENKTGYISSESASSISPAALAVGHVFKKTSLKRGKFDALVENPVENCVQNIQPNVNDTFSSRQESNDVCAELDVLKAPAFDKIDGKINKKHLQHNLFGSVIGKEESVQQNVEEQQTDISLAKNYTQNTFATNVSADIDDLKAPVYPKIVGKINKKHPQHSFFASDVGSEDENVEEQNSGIAVTKNCAQKTLAANTKESSDISVRQKFVMNVFNKEKSGSISPQTSKLSQIQEFSHNSQSIEDRRQMNEGDHNSSINKLAGRKVFPSITGTSVHNSPVLPEFGRSTDSPVDSLTISKFRPKITSSKIYLAKDRIAEQYPHTSSAIQQKVASNTFNILTCNKEQKDQSNNPTVYQPKSTDDVSAEINYKKRKKYDSDSLPSSDLTFDPDNVPHSTMVQSSSKKKRPPPDMHREGNRSRRSLINLFGDLAEVSKESGKRISMETEDAVIRITSNGKESENELAVETERNYNGTKISELQPNEHYSNTVKEDSNFSNKISVPGNLHAVLDHEPFAERISTNILKSLSLVPRPPSVSDIDVSQVFSHASHKTKSLAKSSSVNSQEKLIKAVGKNEKKCQGNSKNISGKLGDSPENIVSGEIINPPSMEGDTKCRVSLPRVGKVSSDSNNKTHENSHRNEEINTRESDRVSLRADRRESLSYSFAEIPCNKLNETDVLTSKKNSNLKSSSKVTGTVIENTSDYSEAPNSRKALSIQKETPELRGLASLSPSASYLNKISHKETSLSFKNSSKGSIRANNKKSTVSNVTNSKMIYPNSPDLCDAIGQLENERGSHRDHQPHLTEADDSDDAPAQNSVINEEVRELSFPLLSASHKKNFSPNFENSGETRSKNLVINSIPNAKITHSDSSNTNNDKRPYLKDSLHRNRQTGNRRQSNPHNQPQLKEGNDGAQEKRSAIISHPLKGSILISHQKREDAKQTQVKPRARACFLIDGKPYKNPKLVRPKCWINQRFYNYVLPKFDKQYGFGGTVRCEKFVELLCSAVTACISNRKNWDMHVDKVQEILHEHLSINNFSDFLIFAQRYLPDEFVFKMCLTHEKRCENK